MNKYQEALDHIIKCDREDCGMSYLSDAYRNDLSVLRELVDKATPKKPILEYVVDGYYYRCSKCGKLILDDMTANSVSGDSLKEDCSYCSRCGTKVDWE